MNWYIDPSWTEYRDKFVEFRYYLSTPGLSPSRLLGKSKLFILK